jgi:hypothetical protein
VSEGNGYAPRLKERYTSEVRAQLKDELGVSTVMQVPRVSKITLNMGVGEAKTEAKQLDSAIEELSTIAGQRAHVRLARKSIAGFKVREGMPVGARVTLRGDRMWEFLDRLVSIACRGSATSAAESRLVRRPRQLLARDPRADHLPGDRLRLDPEHPRPRRRDHHDAPRTTSRGWRSSGRSGCRSPKKKAPKESSKWPRRR